MPSSKKAGYRKKYGRLTVLYPSRVVEYPSRIHQYFLCQCICGTIKEIRLDHLKSKATRSCGCLASELTSKRMSNMDHTVHGMSNTSMYGSWQSMQRRVLDSTNKSYKHYGGKGITFDPSWLDFVQFMKDVGKTWFFGAHLHRKNSSLGYFKENCKWLSPSDHAILHAKLRKKVHG